MKAEAVCFITHWSYCYPLVNEFIEKLSFGEIAHALKPPREKSPDHMMHVIASKLY